MTFESVDANGIPFNEQIYPLSVGRLIAQTITYLIFSAFFGAAMVLFIRDKTWLAVAFLAVGTLFCFGKAMSFAVKIPKNRRIGLGISHYGLRVPSGLIPWDQVERVVLVCLNLPQKGAARSKVDQVVVFERARTQPKTGTKVGRIYPTAYVDQLKGGHAAYLQLGLELSEWCAAKDVPIELVEMARPWRREQFPHIPVITLEQYNAYINEHTTW